jgi:hypothetical protein
MSDSGIKNHVPLPKNTPAVICAGCGAVALDPNNICRPQGRGTKADWCGTRSAATPASCHKRVNTTRYACANCRQVAINPELLCAPEKMLLTD